MDEKTYSREEFEAAFIELLHRTSYKYPVTIWEKDGAIILAALRLASSHSEGTEPQPVANYTFDEEADAYYIALAGRKAPPYMRQSHVKAVLDLDDDGRLAGIEIVGAGVDPPAARPLSASKVVGEQKEEVGWLVEYTNAAGLQYWAGVKEFYNGAGFAWLHDWTADYLKAVRFARRNDAAIVAASVRIPGCKVSAVEHMWLSAAGYYEEFAATPAEGTERERIVAWLRKEEDGTTYRDNEYGQRVKDYPSPARLASAIERGDHLASDPSPVRTEPQPVGWLVKAADEWFYTDNFEQAEEYRRDDPASVRDLFTRPLSASKVVGETATAPWGPRLETVREQIAGEEGPENAYTEEMVDRLILAAGEDYQSALAATPADAERGEWQPIETAPKDGTMVDLYGARNGTAQRFPNGKWVQNIIGGMELGTYSWAHYGWDIYGKFTYSHWQPPPAPPADPSPVRTEG